MSTQSYTVQLLDTYMQGLLASKEANGMRMTKTGLVEDIVGNLLAFDIKQSITEHGQGEEAFQVHHVNIVLKRALVANI